MKKLISAFLLILSSQIIQASSLQAVHVPNTFERIEAAHINALENNNDTASLTKLFYEVSAPVYVNPSVIDHKYVDILCPLLVKAEQRYRNGTSKGVTEKQLLKTYNDLATSLGLPEEAQLIEEDVTSYRKLLISRMPNFILTDSLPKTPNGNRKLREDMSPLVAYHEIAVIVNAKLLSRSFSLKPSDRRQALATKASTGVLPIPKYDDDPADKSGNELSATPSKNNIAIKKAIQKSLGNMSDADGLTLTYKVLSDLGIM